MSHDHREALAEAIDAEWTRPEHACGGDDAACPQMCPVPAYGRMGLDELRDAAVTALLGSDVLAQIRAEARAEAWESAAREAQERGDIGKDGGVEAWDWLRGLIRRAALAAELSA